MLSRWTQLLPTVGGDHSTRGVLLLGRHMQGCYISCFLFLLVGGAHIYDEVGLLFPYAMLCASPNAGRSA